MENRAGRGSILSRRFDISKPGGGINRGSITNRANMSPRFEDVEAEVAARAERGSQSAEPENPTRKPVVRESRPFTGRGVLPVRVEKWGAAGEVRIASVTADLTSNKVAPDYSKPEQKEQHEPIKTVSERTETRHTDMAQGMVFRLSPVETLAT